MSLAKHEHNSLDCASIGPQHRRSSYPGIPARLGGQLCSPGFLRSAQGPFPQRDPNAGKKLTQSSNPQNWQSQNRQERKVMENYFATERKPPWKGKPNLEIWNQNVFVHWVLRKNRARNDTLAKFPTRTKRSLKWCPRNMAELLQKQPHPILSERKRAASCWLLCLKYFWFLVTFL